MSGVLDYLLLAEQYMEMAVELAEPEADVDQEDALRRLFYTSRISRSADALNRHANTACEQNEKARGWS